MDKISYSQTGQVDNIIRRMRITCWITKTTDTYLKYVILTVFRRQERLRERASVLHYTYIVLFIIAREPSSFEHVGDHPYVLKSA